MATLEQLLGAGGGGSSNWWDDIQRLLRGGGGTPVAPAQGSGDDDEINAALAQLTPSGQGQGQGQGGLTSFELDRRIKEAQLAKMLQPQQDRTLPQVGGAYAVGGQLYMPNLDPASGGAPFSNVTPERQPGDLERRIQEAQIARLQRPAEGRTQFASEAGLQNAQALLAQAQAGDLQARRQLEQMGMFGQDAQGNRTLGGQQLDAQIAQQTRAYELQLRQQGLSEQQASQQANQFAQQLQLQRQTAEGQQDIARGGLDIQRSAQDLQRQLGMGQLDISRSAQDLQRQLGLGGLGVQQGRLGLDTRALENQIGQQGADRALQQGVAMGRIGDQDTLAREMGMGQLGLGQRAQSLSELIQTGQLGNQTAELYGFGNQGRTLDAQRLAGELTGGGQTLENIFGRAGLTGTLDGQQTIGGRQQAAAEQAAAFQRATTPSMAGALAGLAARGMIPQSAVQTGDISGLMQQPQQPGGLGAYRQPQQSSGSMLDMQRTQGPQMRSQVMQQPQRLGTNDADQQEMAMPSDWQQRRQQAMSQQGRAAVSINEGGGQMRSQVMQPGQLGEADMEAAVQQSQRLRAQPGQPQRLGTNAGQPQQPLNFSLQSLKPLTTRETQGLSGFTGAFGQSLQDIGEKAQQEMDALGQGAGRRGRVRVTA